MARYTAPTRVAHERVEDEVIAINLTTGTYFSLCDSAADAWTLLVDGADVAGAATALGAAHGMETANLITDLQAYVVALVEAGLLVEDPNSAPSAVAAPPSTSRAYTAPRIERYDDMEELLLLDPIHEVDDAGWPIVPVEPR